MRLEVISLVKKQKELGKDSIKKILFIIFFFFFFKKDGLTDKEKIVLKNIGKYLKKLNIDFKKLNKYQDNTTYGLDYLFNEFNEEDKDKVEEIKMLN